jgi:hypothetical protein
MRLDGPQGWSERCREENIFLLMLEMEPRFFTMYPPAYMMSWLMGSNGEAAGI